MNSKIILKFFFYFLAGNVVLLLLLINYFYVSYSNKDIRLPVEQFEISKKFPQDLNEEEKIELSKIQYEIISLDQVPKHCINAIISIEDKNFWTNSGIDRNGLIRLGFASLPIGSKSGGSTISQQVIKMSTNRFYSRSLLDKLKEIVWSVRLNDSISKEVILERYLNNVYVGEYNYGIAQAAKAYFNKNIENLDLAECSYLAGLLQLPNLYIPKEGEFPEVGKIRQLDVLKLMVRNGYISDGELQDAYGEML